MTQRILEKINQQLAAGLYPGASLSLYRDGHWQSFYLGLADPASQSATRAGQEFFVPKSKKFLVSQDQSNIELWFEQL